MKKDASTKKRKEKGNGGEIYPSASTKRPRRTIDSFFLPSVLTSSSTAGKDKSGKRVPLNDEQNRVLRMVVDEGRNVFFTGSAGTGKSLLLRAIISGLRKRHRKEPDRVSVTASTGMAASNIGGMTLHAWGALATDASLPMGQFIARIKRVKAAAERWRTTRVLVIDEVSMVDGHLFDRLDAIASTLRKDKEAPFGGIQLVVTGDFFQLPPVTKRGEEPFFAFESDAWKTCIDETVVLTQVFRQTDTTFVDLLNEIRKGELSSCAIKTFRSLSRELPPSTPVPGILPTELFPVRSQVEEANSERLRALPSPSRSFFCSDSGNDALRDALLSAMAVPSILRLKVGAQVMLLKNLDCEDWLVNGSVGKVVGFFKSSQVFGTGIAGTGALRGVKTPVDGLGPHAEDEGDDDKENWEDLGGTQKRVRGRKEERLPLVQFCTPDGMEAVLLGREEFKHEDNQGRVLAKRVQIPLILAWAMSIHKSQGQTIDRVKVDLRRVFEKGQTYVALSRATALDGLQVLGFSPDKVSAHPKVLEWNNRIHQDLGRQGEPQRFLPMTS